MHQEPALHDDGGGLVAAVRQGDAGACQQIVRRHGLEVLRTTYLLTGSSRQSASLAHATFLGFFRRPPRPEGEIDLGVHLLLRTGEMFLAPDNPDSDDGPPLLSIIDVPRSERYQVDDARSRTLDGLALIDPPARLALVLREFNGLTVEQIAPLLQERPDQTTTTLEVSRRRMRNHPGLLPDESLRTVFAAATFDAPSGNLWVDLEDEVTDILRRQGQRKRVISAAVVTFMLAAMLVTLAILLREPAPDEVVAESTRFVTNSYNDPAPFPTIAPPRATGTNPARAVRMPSPSPSEEVPDLSLLALREAETSDGLAHLTEFRPGHSIPIQPLVDWPRLNRESRSPVLSPDGSTLYVSHFETQGDMVSVLVSALESDGRQLLWRAELARVPAGLPGEKLDVFVSLAADETRVFATLHHWKENDLIQLVILDQETGNRVDGWPVNIAGRVANDVRVLRPPESKHIYVFAITQAQPALTGQMHISFYGYEVETGAQVHGKTLGETESRRVLYIYRNQVTVDGRSLVGTTYRNNTGELAVQFFDLFTATVQPPVPVPFTVEGNREPVQEAISHDGRWLYIFSPLSAEVAIVDVQQRSLRGIIPLDVQIPGVIGAVNLQDATMQISPDGSRIYAIGAQGSTDTAGVWVIDTTSWQLTHHWLPASSPARILLSGDGSTLYVHESTGSTAHGRIIGLDTATGETLFHEDLGFLPDSTSIDLMSLAALYRKQFGRSPAVEGLQPEDNRAYTSLPRIEASMTMPEIAAGDEIGIRVRFVDPVSGNMLTESQSKARYEPPPGVRAILRDLSGESRDIVLELGRRGYAEYTGLATVDAPGNWSLILVNDWSNTGQLITTHATLKVIAPTPGFGSGSL